jgi:hypothetical protein
MFLSRSSLDKPSCASWPAAEERTALRLGLLNGKSTAYQSSRLACGESMRVRGNLISHGLEQSPLLVLVMLQSIFALGLCHLQKR